MIGPKPEKRLENERDKRGRRDYKTRCIERDIDHMLINGPYTGETIEQRMNNE